MVPWSKTATTEAEVVEKVERENCSDGDVQRVHADAKSESKTQKDEATKETFRLTLGSYRGTVVPLAVLFFGYTCGAIAVSPMKPDTRVKDWFLMGSSVPTIAICVLYVLFSVVWGPNLMKNRPPFRLKRIMVVYNAFQVYLSAHIFYHVGIAGWFFDYSYFCEPCDYSLNPKPMSISGIAWLFFISKIIDFTDTLFFILNKKWSNISMLHVVHHSCMCISMWYGVKYTPGGHITFMGFLNSGVHVIMYTYYLLSALGPAVRPYLWWKKYLTTIQLVQFIAIFLHAAQLLFIDCPTVPIGLAMWTCIYALIFFTLFIDFYYYAYLHPSKKGKRSAPPHNAEGTKEQVAANGIVKNDGWEVTKNLQNGHIRSPSNLPFRLDSCLRERQPASN